MIWDRHDMDPSIKVEVVLLLALGTDVCKTPVTVSRTLIYVQGGCNPELETKQQQLEENIEH